MNGNIRRTISLVIAAAALFGIAFEKDAQAYDLGGPAAALTPRSTEWSWDSGIYLSDLRTALEDADNFGATGPVTTPVVTSDLAVVDLAALSTLDGFIAPFWADVDVTAAQVNDLVSFFLAGGDLVLLQDDSRYDAIGSALGISTTDNADLSPTTGGLPLFIGPFGAAGAVSPKSRAGSLDPTAIAALNGAVAGVNGMGQATVAFWRSGRYAPGAGNLLIIADVDMWSTFEGNADYTTLNNAARFALNSMAVVVLVCGDGASDPGEECDDANSVNGDGCDNNCTFSACGNEVLSGAEECDDGNLDNGDGCSDTCVCESAGDTDLDGIPDACDNCAGTSNSGQEDLDVDGIGNACDACPADPSNDIDSDGNCADADICPFDPDDDLDADDICGDIDPCTNPGGVRTLLEKSKLRFKFINTDPTPHNDRFSVKGNFDLPGGSTFGSAVDPMTTPIRVRVEDDDGTAEFDVTFPTSAFDKKITPGWVVNGKATVWQFKDRRPCTQPLPTVPSCADGGLVQIKIVDKSKKAPGRVFVKVVGKAGDYPFIPSDLPVKAQVIIGDPAKSECAEAAFDVSGGTCKFANLDQSLICKK